MWKLHDFSIIQILREFIGETRSTKDAVFAILGAVEFVNLVNIRLPKAQKLMKIKIQSLKMC